MKATARIDDTVCSNIRAVMAEAGVSVYELAKRTGIARQTLDGQLGGKAALRVNVLVLVADALATDPAELLLDTPELLRIRASRPARRRRLRAVAS